MSCQRQISIAIVGAGPIGLELAARLLTVGASTNISLFERGPSVGHNVIQWSHVRLFSPWSMNVSTWGRSLVGLSVVDETQCPTGREYLDHYLLPLAGKVEELGVSLHLNRQVVAIARHSTSFYLLSRSAEGSDCAAYADVVFDTTGTFGNFNRLGPGGAPALNELRLEEAGLIHRTIPSIDECKAICGAHDAAKIVCVGTGYSAVTTLANVIKAVRQSSRSCELIWITRKAPDARPYPIIDGDVLEERSSLSALGNALATGERTAIPEHLTFRYLPGSTILELSPAGGSSLSMTLTSFTGEAVAIAGITHLIANVGYKPDLAMIRELDVQLCYKTEGPIRLASKLVFEHGQGERSDCLTHHSFGSSSLITSEPDFFVLGAKSYGRLPTFLLRTGIEQIAEVVALLLDKISTN